MDVLYIYPQTLFTGCIFSIYGLDTKVVGLHYFWWKQTQLKPKGVNWQCTVRAPVFGRHHFFGTSEHYGKAHGSLLSGWMNYHYTACCWFPTSSNILILPSQFWQIRFESCWFHCAKKPEFKVPNTGAFRVTVHHSWWKQIQSRRVNGSVHYDGNIKAEECRVAMGVKIHAQLPLLVVGGHTCAFPNPLLISCLIGGFHTKADSKLHWWWIVIAMFELPSEHMKEKTLLCRVCGFEHSRAGRRSMASFCVLLTCSLIFHLG